MGTDSAASRLDVRGGSITVERGAVEVFLASATQTGSITTGGVQVWSPITGVTAGFNLPRAMVIHMRGHGAANPISGAHCGFRFMVDGVGQGNVSWGDTVFYATAGWSSWSIEREVALASGVHTISMEQVSNVSAGCITSSNAYSATRLWIYAR